MSHCHRKILPYDSICLSKINENSQLIHIIEFHTHVRFCALYCFLLLFYFGCVMTVGFCQNFNHKLITFKANDYINRIASVGFNKNERYKKKTFGKCVGSDFGIAYTLYVILWMNFVGAPCTNGKYYVQRKWMLWDVRFVFEKWNRMTAYEMHAVNGVVRFILCTIFSKWLDNGADCVCVCVTRLKTHSSAIGVFFIVLIWVYSIHWLIFQTDCRLHSTQIQYMNIQRLEQLQHSASTLNRFCHHHHQSIRHAIVSYPGWWVKSCSV